MSTNIKAAASDVVVVGAGIAGLTAAYRLTQLGYNVVVLEAKDYIGGRMSTVQCGGYSIDRCALWLSESYRDMRRLISETGLSSSTCRTSDLMGIVRGGRVHYFRLSRPRSGFMRTDLLSWQSKLKAVGLLKDLRELHGQLHWRNLSAAADRDTESAADYSLRRLNQELLDYLIAPAVTSAVHREPDRASVVSAFYAFTTYFGHSTFNFREGIDTLPRELARHVNLVLDATVTSVKEINNGVAIRWETSSGEACMKEAAGCVLAIQGDLIPSIAPGLAAAQVEYLKDVQYMPDLTIHLGVRLRPAEAATFILMPPAESSDINYIVFNHNIAPGRAPTGKGLIRISPRSSWASRHWSMDDNDVMAGAVESLRNVLPDLADHIATYHEMTHVHRENRTFVVRDRGDYKRLQSFASGLSRSSRIQLAGDCLAWSSTNTCLATGELAARRLTAVLRP